MDYEAIGQYPGIGRVEWACGQGCSEGDVRWLQAPVGFDSRFRSFYTLPTNLRRELRWCLATSDASESGSTPGPLFAGIPAPLE